MPDHCIRVSEADRERLEAYRAHCEWSKTHFAAPGVDRFSVGDLLRRLLSSSPSGVVDALYSAEDFIGRVTQPEKWCECGGEWVDRCDGEMEWTECADCETVKPRRPTQPEASERVMGDGYWRCDCSVDLNPPKCAFCDRCGVRRPDHPLYPAPPQPEGERWTIWVCDGCGAYGGVNELDRFGNHLVHHGESLHASDCVRPARQVEVVARSLLTDALRERDEARRYEHRTAVRLRAAESSLRAAQEALERIERSIAAALAGPSVNADWEGFLADLNGRIVRPALDRDGGDSEGEQP